MPAGTHMAQNLCQLFCVCVGNRVASEDRIQRGLGEACLPNDIAFGELQRGDFLIHNLLIVHATERIRVLAQNGTRTYNSAPRPSCGNRIKRVVCVSFEEHLDKTVSFLHNEDVF